MVGKDLTLDFIFWKSPPDVSLDSSLISFHISILLRYYSENKAISYRRYNITFFVQKLHFLFRKFYASPYPHISPRRNAKTSIKEDRKRVDLCKRTKLFAGIHITFSKTVDLHHFRNNGDSVRNIREYANNTG